jgi:hypothetical protein
MTSYVPKKASLINKIRSSTKKLLSFRDRKSKINHYAGSPHQVEESASKISDSFKFHALAKYYMITKNPSTGEVTHVKIGHLNSTSQDLENDDECGELLCQE